MNNALNEFEACWYDPNFGDEMVEGTISFDRWTLFFKSEPISEEIPLDRIEVVLNKDGERIDFLDSARPSLVLYTLDDAVLASPMLPQAEQARRKRVAILTRREMRVRYRMIAYFVGGCFILYLLGALVVNMAAKSLAMKVPSEWEKKASIGELELLADTSGFITNAAAEARLAEIAAPLLKVVPVGDRTITFKILNNNDPNAGALPDGHIVVNTGLLEMAETEEELLAVLSHELAHVSKRHFARQLISSAGPVVILGIFVKNGNGLVKLLASGYGNLVMTGFSREYETEADDASWQYMLDAHIDPRGAISMFKKMQSYETKLGADMPQGFSDHPALDQRIERMENRWKKLAHPPEFLQLTNGVPKIPKSEKDADDKQP